MSPENVKVANRSVDILHPDARMAWLRLLEACGNLDRAVFMAEGYRTAARQDALYAQGRTTPGKIITRSRGWESWHQTGRAVDFAFIHGLPYAESHPWAVVGQMAEVLGFEWGGRWPAPKTDRPHIQWTGGLTLAEAVAEAKADPRYRGK